MASPQLESAARSTRTEAQARAERLSMTDVIRAGADAAIAAEPHKLAQAKSRTMQAIDAAVEALPPFPPFPRFTPLPELGTGKFLAAPCNAPRERLGAIGFNPTCQCGWLMGEHRKDGAK